jgi:glycosyltransferase involved in cell wall biosynthesis
VRAYTETVLVIDDGSADGTAELAASHGAHVIRNERSCGKGAALESGMRWLHERGFMWTLAMDGDGQHLPAEIPHFFEMAERSQASMIVGNRMPYASSIPWLRRIVNRWMSKQLSRISGQELPDTQCGFRLVRVPAWVSLELRARHFEIESESLLAFIAAGHTVRFVPVRAIYQAERSKIRPLRDSIRWLRWVRRAKRLDWIGRYSEVTNFTAA